MNVVMMMMMMMGRRDSLRRKKRRPENTDVVMMMMGRRDSLRRKKRRSETTDTKHQVHQLNSNKRREPKCTNSIATSIVNSQTQWCEIPLSRLQRRRPTQHNANVGFRAQTLEFPQHIFKESDRSGTCVPRGGARNNRCYFIGMQ
jgi:hypothetical protein